MNDKKKQNLSAQVILRPAAGKSPLSPEEITSENVRQMMPSAEDLEKAEGYFSNSGFEVSAGYANSFSITGDKKLFEKTFGAKIFTGDKQAVKARGENDTESSELPLGELPKEVKKSVEAITFTEPPDFGPGNF